MATSVYNSDGTLFASIPDGEVDTSSPVKLFGIGADPFLESLNENQLRILQNFASATAPANPIEGVIWWNPDAGTLSLYRSGVWVDVIDIEKIADQLAGPILVAANANAVNYSDALNDAALSQFQSLLDGAFDDLTSNVGSIQDFANTIAADVANAATDIDIAAVQEDIDTAANAAINAATGVTFLRAYVDPLIHDANGSTVLTLVQNETNSRTEADTVTTAAINLIGEVNGDSSAFVLDQTTVQVSPGQTFSQWGALLLATANSNVSGANAALVAQITAVDNARIAGDIAVAGTVITVGTRLDSNTASLAAAITNEANARTTADTTEATARTVLAAQLLTANTNLTAAIIAEQTARVTADGATATTIGLLGATGGGGTTFVLNESSVFFGTTGSIASVLSSLNSSISGLGSSISAETTARTTANSTLAASITTLSSTVGGHTTSISTLLSTTADTDGRLSSVYGVYTGGGTIAQGFQLLTQGGGSTQTTTFDVYATAFRVFNGSSSVPAFQVSGGNLYVLDNGVQTSTIVLGAVQTSYIATLGSNIALPTTTGSRVGMASVTISKGLATSDVRIEYVMRTRPGQTYAGYFVVWGPSGDMDTIWYWAPTVSIGGVQSIRIPQVYLRSFSGYGIGSLTFGVDFVMYAGSATGGFMEAGSTFEVLERKRT
jgi:hypothetical protein